MEMKAKCDFETRQQCPDNVEYYREAILRYEKIHGKGYVTTGGRQTTEELVAMLDLKPGQRVLDVGSGIGGGDFFVAEKYGVEVVGIDLSNNMVEIAMDRAREHKGLKVQFEIADVTKRDYEPASYDVIYSRDTILHIADQKSLFAKFMIWLKPGGKLLISDYCCGDLPHTETFKKYVERLGYNLHTPEQYGELLEEAGFVNVKAEDRTWQFIKFTKEEVARLVNKKEDFLKEYSEDDFKCTMDGWNNKLKWCKAGDQKWGIFLVEKAVEC